MSSKTAAACHHPEFTLYPSVVRLGRDPDAAAEGFMLEVRVECADCGRPFRFRGAQLGLAMTHPTRSLEGTELRAPIEPVPESPQPVPVPPQRHLQLVRAAEPAQALTTLGT